MDDADNYTYAKVAMNSFLQRAIVSKRNEKQHLNPCFSVHYRKEPHLIGSYHNQFLAERGGFEPPSGITLNTLSRRAT